jgi:hypothetical protein
MGWSLGQGWRPGPFLGPRIVPVSGTPGRSVRSWLLRPRPGVMAGSAAQAARVSRAAGLVRRRVSLPSFPLLLW